MPYKLIGSDLSALRANVISYMQILYIGALNARRTQLSRTTLPHNFLFNIGNLVQEVHNAIRCDIAPPYSVVDIQRLTEACIADVFTKHYALPSESTDHLLNLVSPEYYGVNMNIVAPIVIYLLPLRIINRNFPHDVNNCIISIDGRDLTVIACP